MIEKDVRFSGYMIGTVKKINVKTRKVAVYLPKLMPAIAETGSKKVITNYGNPSLDVTHREYLTSVDYIWTSAVDADEPMPEVGSKVLIWFLESSPWAGYWEKFNSNKDYSVIPDERYKSLCSVQIGDKTVPLYESDLLKINLPENMKVVLIKGEKEYQVNIIDTSNNYSKNEVDSIAMTLNSKVDNLSATIEKNYNTLNATIENTVENINSTIKDINTQITNILARLTTNETNIADINKQLDNVNSEITTLKASVSDINEVNTTINEEIANIKERLTSLENPEENTENNG